MNKVENGMENRIIIFMKNTMDAINSLGGGVIRVGKLGFTGFSKYSRVTGSKIRFYVNNEYTPAAVIEYLSKNVHGGIVFYADELYAEVYAGTINEVVEVSYDDTIDVQAVMYNPLIDSDEIFGVREFLLLFELLSLMKWPTTNVPVVLKNRKVKSISCRNNTIALLDSSGNVIGTTFASSYGTLTCGESLSKIRIGDETFKLFTRPTTLEKLFHNITVAIYIARKSDLIREFDVVD